MKIGRLLRYTHVIATRYRSVPNCTIHRLAGQKVSTVAAAYLNLFLFSVRGCGIVHVLDRFFLHFFSPFLLQRGQYTEPIDDSEVIDS
jgi:hypothetical protein